MKNYYKTLGVDRFANSFELKNEFRKKAKESHPDTSSYNTDEKFKELKEAYDTLSDPHLRAIYEREFDNQYFEKVTQFNVTKFNLSITKDIIMHVTIPLEKAIFGGEITIKAMREFMAFDENMQEDMETKTEDIIVNIPPNTINMSKIKISNKGNSIITGKVNKDYVTEVGDLYLTITFDMREENTYLQWNTVHTSVLVPFHAMIAEKEIEFSIFGSRKFKVKLEINKKNYLITKAIHDYDLIIKVETYFPEKELSYKEKKSLYKVMEKIYGIPTTTF